MLKKFDVVRAKGKLGRHVDIGTMGTVLIVYHEAEYEVEFVSENGITLDILVVSINDIEILNL